MPGARRTPLRYRRPIRISATTLTPVPARRYGDYDADGGGDYHLPRFDNGWCNPICSPGGGCGGGCGNFGGWVRVVRSTSAANIWAGGSAAITRPRW